MTEHKQWHSTPVLLPGKSHGRRSLEGCSLWGRWGSDTTERLHFHFSLSCIGEGNGNPLQCSCLENPRDGGVWWVAVYGVAQSQTRLKWLSSSNLESVSYSPWRTTVVCMCIHIGRDVCIHRERQNEKIKQMWQNANNWWICVKSIQEFRVYWRFQIVRRGNFLYYIGQSQLK